MDDRETYTSDTAKMEHIRHRFRQAKALALALNGRPERVFWTKVVEFNLASIEDEIKRRIAAMD